MPACDRWRDDRVTCASCGSTGIGIGFAHDCDPIDARRERAAIVAWLRSAPLTTGLTHRNVADAIERGDHLVRAKDSKPLRPREG